jgi:hypothetical protein
VEGAEVLLVMVETGIAVGGADSEVEAGESRETMMIEC